MKLLKDRYPWSWRHFQKSQRKNALHCTEEPQLTCLPGTCQGYLIQSKSLSKAIAIKPHKYLFINIAFDNILVIIFVIFK